MKQIGYTKFKKNLFYICLFWKGSFTWKVAEICTQQGFWPDIISTDIHSGNKYGPVYDLTSVMSKMLHLGMPIRDVIKAVTSSPAQAVRRQASIGSLSAGRCADVTLLKLEDMSIDLEDSEGHTRKLSQKIVPMGVWRAGKRFDIFPSEKYPNFRENDWTQLVEHLN